MLSQGVPTTRVEEQDRVAERAKGKRKLISKSHPQSKPSCIPAQLPHEWYPLSITQLPQGEKLQSATTL